MKRQYLFDVFNLILPYAIISAASLVELLLPAYVESGKHETKKRRPIIPLTSLSIIIAHLP